MNKKIIVDKEMELYSFLREKLSSLSKNNVKSLLKRKMIKVNDKIVTSYDYILKKIVGHEIRDITEKVYTHRNIEELISEIEKIHFL